MGILNDGLIQFRHPLAREGDGKGKVIRRGVTKLGQERAGRIAAQLEALLRLLPRTPSELPKDIEWDAVAVDAWFKPLGQGEDWVPAKVWTETPTAKGIRERLALYESGADISMPLAREFLYRETVPSKWLVRADHELAKTTAALIMAELRVRELEAQAKAAWQAAGQRIGKAQSITLAECQAHFEKHVSCKSEEARSRLARRVATIVNRIGKNKKHADITQKSITDAATAKTETEKSYLLRDAKKFFFLLSLPPEADGLNLPNPAMGIRPGTGKRRNGKVETLDPLALLKNENLSPYWKALVAACGLAGLRLGEAAGLTWDSLDFDAGVVHVRAGEEYDELKSAMSERDIKPFAQFWEVLEAHKGTKTGGLVFPHGEGSWFKEYEGKARATELVRQFKDALKKATGAAKVSEPARRLRRYWETAMRSKGLGHLIPVMGGHSSEVGLAHYTKFADVVKTATVGLA